MVRMGDMYSVACVLSSTTVLLTGKGSTSERSERIQVVDCSLGIIWLSNSFYELSTMLLSTVRTMVYIDLRTVLTTTIQ